MTWALNTPSLKLKCLWTQLCLVQSNLSDHWGFFVAGAFFFLTLFVLQNRIFQLRGSYSNHLVQLPDQFQANQVKAVKGNVQTPLKHWQAWGIDHLPRAPVPEFEEMFPNVQSEPALEQLWAIPTHPISRLQGEKLSTSLPTSLPQRAVESNEVMFSLLFFKPDKSKTLGCSSQDTASKPCTSLVTHLWMQGLNIFPQQISVFIRPFYLMRRETDAKAEIILWPGRHSVTVQGSYTGLAPQHLWLCCCRHTANFSSAGTTQNSTSLTSWCVPLLLLLTKEAQVSSFCLLPHNRVHEYTV